MKKLFISAMILVSLLQAKDYVRDSSTGLLWQDTFDVKDLEMTYEEAQEYCHNLKILDQSGWRVPKLNELESIVDRNRYKPAILKGFDYEAKEVYWSSTPAASDPEKDLWVIDFTDGKTNIKGRHYDRYVRCVKDMSK